MKGVKIMIYIDLSDLRREGGYGVVWFFFLKGKWVEGGRGEGG